MKICQADWLVGDMSLAGTNQPQIQANIESWVGRFDQDERHPARLPGPLARHDGTAWELRRPRAAFAQATWWQRPAPTTPRSFPRRGAARAACASCTRARCAIRPSFAGATCARSAAARRRSTCSTSAWSTRRGASSGCIAACAGSRRRGSQGRGRQRAHVRDAAGERHDPGRAERSDRRGPGVARREGAASGDPADGAPGPAPRPAHSRPRAHARRLRPARASSGHGRGDRGRRRHARRRDAAGRRHRPLGHGLRGRPLLLRGSAHRRDQERRRAGLALRLHGAQPRRASPVLSQRRLSTASARCRGPTRSWPARSSRTSAARRGSTWSRRTGSTISSSPGTSPSATPACATRSSAGSSIAIWR